MDLNDLITKVNVHYQKELPFVMYSLPESEMVTAYFQNSNELCKTEDFTSESFVFAPFQYENNANCIPKELCEVFEINYSKSSIPLYEIDIEENQIKREEYYQLVQKAIEKVKSSLGSKIVVSRSEEIPVKEVDIPALIVRLINLYNPAFRYIWYHPLTGLWCGATPELLLKTDGAAFQTMALAGTQKVIENKSPSWTEKEKEEQQIVTDSITSSLEKVTSILKVSKTYNFQAASLVHLRTDITGIFNKGKTTLSNITSVLHPTPAVCGTPKKNAALFINDNENYDREYYTGFLGPICGKENCSKLFVNLRCMKIDNDKATLYVGGGITKDSNDIDEWQETQNKMQTMLQVLQPML